MTKRDMLYAANFLRKAPIEHLYLFCIKDDKIVEKVDVGRDGTEDSVFVYISDIVNYLKKGNYTEYFIAHNHPDCPALPSEKDVSLTKDIFDETKAHGMTMVDHIIMSLHNSFSFKETNFLDSLEVLAS